MQLAIEFMALITLSTKLSMIVFINPDVPADYYCMCINLAPVTDMMDGPAVIISIYPI